MNKVAVFDFPTQRTLDGLKSFTMTFRYASGTPLDFSGKTVQMQIKNVFGVLKYEFSSALTGENNIAVLPAGVIQFPEIKRWNLPQTKYFYELAVIDNNGFTQTYLKGTWVFVN